MTELRLTVPPLVQPDEVSCGPTCLAAVLQFHGVDTDVARVRAKTPRNPDGGTFAPYLGRAAIAHGMRVCCHPFAVQVFDPSWWDLPHDEVARRLRLRTEGLKPGRLRRVHEAWLAYMMDGGDVELGELRTHRLTDALDAGHPLICGLSITWLYQEPRERPHDNQDDDIHGAPVGHFVVVTGYAEGGDSFFVTDPWPQPPFDREEGVYTVGRRRLTQAILLGDATHDAVIVEILPGGPS
ncbi:MAG: C39 family peptidase [Alphaproteobacteria bacterium]|nr:C39 family peptidase [Alphaproteobacteria bacterium]